MHTPGPWTTDADGFIYARPDAGLPERYNGGACLVIAVTGRRALPADARLIAAAPDLLAALVALVQDVDVGEIDYSDADRKLVLAAREAIRKATEGSV